MSRFDEKARRTLRGAAVLVPVLSGPSSLVLIARMPSQKARPTGYCGAGYEDHLLLLSYARQQISLLDDFLLQSCLKSIVLESDHGDDILAALSIDRQRSFIQFKWLSDPDNQVHNVTISQQKFVLDQAQ